MKKIRELITVNEEGTPEVPYYHKFPKTIATALNKISTDLYDKSIEELETMVRPNHTDRRIKKALWDEFAHADKHGTKMLLKRICHGICNVSHFTKRIGGNPALALWLISPMVEYNDTIESLLEDVKGRYEELINMPIVKFRDGEPTDEVDPKKAAVLLSVIKNLEDRAVGMALQRSVSIKQTIGEKDEIVDVDVKRIDERLKELELQLGETTPTGAIENIVDAEVIDCNEAPVQRLIDEKERSQETND
jgi:hypothetical protein